MEQREGLTKLSDLARLLQLVGVVSYREVLEPILEKGTPETLSGLRRIKRLVVFQDLGVITQEDSGYVLAAPASAYLKKVSPHRQWASALCWKHASALIMITYLHSGGVLPLLLAETLGMQLEEEGGLYKLPAEQIKPCTASLMGGILGVPGSEINSVLTHIRTLIPDLLIRKDSSESLRRLYVYQTNPAKAELLSSVIKLLEEGLVCLATIQRPKP